MQLMAGKRRIHVGIDNQYTLPFGSVNGVPIMLAPKFFNCTVASNEAEDENSLTKTNNLSSGVFSEI